MTLGLHQPIPGGSEYLIEYDGPKQKEIITIHLPPVGYTIDRMPDPETGVPSFQLIKCEILGEDLPLEKQKWIKPELPKDWIKWRDEEKRQKRFNTGWVHPEAEKFRAREWTRRINGCWQALGNRNGLPTEYVYIAPNTYLYLAWWNPDFGYPSFRKVYFKTFYSLQWAEDNPKVNGIVLSTYRRHGKTSIAGCWTIDMPTRMQFSYGAMQGQAGKKSLEFFDIHLLQPFRRLEEIDFFQPKYDRQASQKSQLIFTDPAPKSIKNKPLNFDSDTRKPLGGRVTCATSSETALDGKKLHRIWLDECFAPGTKILCEGLEFRAIEDIQVGDKVIVEGGELIEVAQTCEGEDEMFTVHQPYGKDYTVNSSHKLYLEIRRRSGNGWRDSLRRMTPADYFKFGPKGRKVCYRMTSEGIEFKERHHTIPPYMLGLWIGDGRQDSLCLIINKESDIPIYDYVTEFAKENNVTFSEIKSTSKKCNYVRLKSDVINFNNELRRLNLMKNKHLPKEYLLDSYNNRLRLLAGIIDTDGSYDKSGSFEIGMSRESLVNDIQFLAASLGFSVSNVRSRRTNYNTTAYRVSITGDLHKIPCLTKRKNLEGYVKQYKSRRCSIKIEPVGVGKYHGITLKTDDDDKRRLILEDFTLSMNCGKWEKVDVLKTVLKYVPCTVDDLRQKIGLLFVPSTVEEMGKGGQEFVDLFEKSVPSLMQKNRNGKTSTSLVSLFIPAYEGVIFDEYGRSIVEDPDPTLITLNEAGVQIKEGAKTFLKSERDAKETEEDRIEEVRKYPFSWFEAKMTSSMNCRFNAQILTKRLEELRTMNRLPYIRGNYEWANEQDGDVEFRRDDIAGRFQVHWQPDMEGGLRENTSKIINNVGFEWGEDLMGRPIKLWHPRNDRLFAAGADPISYKDKTKKGDQRLSKGGAHIFRKFDPHIDQGRKEADWESHNFVVQYLFRPDIFNDYVEDMIKMIRYWGCSINAEDNIQALRQAFDQRGYGAFILFRRDFDNISVMGNGDLDRPMRSNPEVIDTYTNRLNTWFYRHGMRCMFPEILEQGLQFDPNDTQIYDCIVSAGYTLIGSEKRQDSDYQENEVDLTSIFPTYDISGNRSKIR